MKFVIITHVDHGRKDEDFYGYSPYVQEMNIWLKYVDKLIIVAPLREREITSIDSSYKHDKIDFRKVADFSLISLKEGFLSVLKMPVIFWTIFWAMKSADHIHLRCPGNMGLIGCFVQILFPGKIKTAKYAGNWDSKSPQPWTYRLQKWILSNTFLTRNMQVLVYGEWERQSENIKPFFTASYFESEKEIVPEKNFDSGVKFIFIGSLVAGKNPLYAIKLVEELYIKGYKVSLDLFGLGSEKSLLENYIKTNNLEEIIILRGNQNKEIIKEALKTSHFVILPSKSEGWPKVLAEGMFWRCIPVGTKISCVPFMLDQGERGILLEMILENDKKQLENILNNKSIFDLKSENAVSWSRKYTLDVFEEEIKKMLLNKG